VAEGFQEACYLFIYGSFEESGDKEDYRSAIFEAVVS
jgi:hypothetical protein